MKNSHFILLLIIAATFSSCGIYSFTGANTGNAKTFQVNNFQNNAEIVEPGISRTFTLELQDRIQTQTNLNLTNTSGDLIYEGEIIDYYISPITATANNTAAQNRLTIAVNVRFYNTLVPEENFERRFSFYYDYPANAQLLGSNLDVALEFIFDRITQDIFNASLADW